MEDYNGWKNYATWRINLEIVSDYMDSFSDYSDEKADKFATIKELADMIKDYVQEFIDQYPDGLVKDYANAFLFEVDYYEIATHYQDLIAED